MDSEVARIAKQSLGVFNQELSPLYTRLMGEFGATALNAVHLADMQTNARNEKANSALITDFVQNLGLEADVEEGTYFDACKVSTSTPENARIAQSLLIWLWWGRSISIPYFIIGRKQIEPKYKGDADTRLLLVTPLKEADDTKPADSKRFVTLDTWDTEVTSFEATGFSRLTRPYDRAELDKMFNSQDEVLKIDESTPQSVTATHPPEPKVRFFLGIPTKPRHPGNTSDNALLLYARSRSFMKNVGISDTVMSSYGTPTYLNRLATLFGKTDVLKNAIDTAVVADENQLDAYIESGGINPEQPQL